MQFQLPEVNRFHGRILAQSQTNREMHKNMGTVQKNDSRCSGLMNENVKYLSVSGGSFPPPRAGEWHNNQHRSRVEASSGLHFCK